MGFIGGDIVSDAAYEKISGIALGLVKENWDEKNLGMVKVELLFGEEGKNMTGWIPYCSQYAGKSFGSYFLPEIASIVVVAFVMGDRERPVVLGSLWTDENVLPGTTANEKNTIKKIRTKAGHEIIFGEEEKKASITIRTAGKQEIFLDDEKKTIRIKDEKGENAIEIDSEKGNIILKAKNKIECNVGGSAMFTLDGSAKTTSIKSDNIKVEAGQGLNLKGQNTKLEGSMLEIKGQSSMKIEGSGIIQLKGAMVKIN